VRYLCLLIGEPGVRTPEPGSAEFMDMLADYQAATSAMAAAGVLVDSGPLNPPSAARTLRIRDGRRHVTDGPYIESKEVIGGYYVLDCDDEAAALRWAEMIPAARYGAIDVRQLMAMPGAGESTGAESRAEPRSPRQY
jgi:hypothetical protein